jgi:hypothetical protein
MPSIESWKAKNKELLIDIDEFQADPSLDRSYRLLKGLGGVMSVVAGLLLPHTQVLKVIIVGLKMAGGFLKGYAEKKE